VSYLLANVEKLAKTSWVGSVNNVIASRRLREGLSPGNGVKLVFVAGPGDDGTDGERLWVDITRRDGACYVGKLRTRPRTVALAAGDTIVFGPEHIADWEP